MNKKNNFFILCILILTVLANPIFSEEEILTLTEEQAVNFAKENSKTLKSAAIDLQIKKRAKDYSWNVLIPSVQASGTISRSNEYSNTIDSIMSAINPYYTPAEVTEENHWKAVGNITASLNLSLALIDGIRASIKNYEAGQISWEQTCKETELNIKKMFYALLLQQESLELQKEALKNAEDRVKQAEINYANGLIPELSLLQTQVSYENQKPSVTKQEQSFQQQIDTFIFILGLPQGTKIQLNGEINPTFITLNPDELYQQYLAKNLDIQAMKKNIELLKIQYSAQNIQIFTPAISLSYGYQPVLSDITSDWKNKDNWYDNGSFSVTLAWNLSNLLPFSSSCISSADVKSNYKKLELTLSTMEENAKVEINNLVNSLNQSKDAIESSNRSISLAQKSYNMTSIAYKNGTTELLDVRDAETQLNQAKLSLLSEKYNYLSGLLDLDYSINK